MWSKPFHAQGAGVPERHPRTWLKGMYVKAVNAGNDLLITTDYQTGYNQILNAVKCGEISEETLNSAVERVLKMKGQI